MNFKNTREQGNSGVGAAIAYCTQMGYPTFIALGESQPYDLVAEIDGALKRIQVKTTRRPAGKGYEVQLKTGGGNQSWNRVIKRFDPTMVDFLFVLTANGKKYMIPAYCVKGKCAINVGRNSYLEFEV